VKLNSLKISGPILALVLGVGTTARATIELQFTWTGTDYEYGFTGVSGQQIVSADAIGIYAFNTSGSVPAIANPFYSVCLSPAGLLDGNPHTYTEKTFASASPGIFPSSWATGPSGQMWGIENAAYLWNTFGNKIVSGLSIPSVSGTANEKAAALEFAIWTVLYNSTGYGKLGGSFYPAPTQTEFEHAAGETVAGGDTAFADYNAYIAALLAKGSSIPIYTGYVLEGTGAPGDGAGAGDDQEFFLLGTPVPESTTLIAGALLLLPFGASTLRILRKNRTA
jgi:hypothetical protein